MLQHEQQAPQLSASAMARYEACAASYSRELEAWNFFQDQKIFGLAIEETAIKGSDINEVFKNIPYVSEKTAIGGKPFNLYRKINQVVAEIDASMKPGDFWFVFKAVRKRDAMIDYLISSVPNPVKNIEIKLDSLRFQKTISYKKHSENVSGLTNVLVIVTDANNQKHALILDYKSGLHPVDRSETNRQLITNAALVRENIADISRVLVGILARDSISEKTKLAEFREPELQLASRWLDRYAKASIDAKEIYEKGNATKLSTKTQAQLETLSQVGDHCFFCRGKVCCTKLHKSIENMSEIYDRDEKQHENFLSARNEIREARKSGNIETIMTTIQLAEAIKTTKGFVSKLNLIEKLNEELCDIARQLNEKGKNLPGIGFESGKTYLRLRDDVDTSPKKVWEAMKPVLPKNLTQTEFLSECCDVDPIKVRAKLSDFKSIPERQVFDKLLTPLKESNPFTIKSGKISVVLVENVEEEQTEEVSEMKI